MINSPKQRGDLGELIALNFLQRQGLALVQQNFRCKGGEIDLILQQTQAPFSLVFVEVRLRKHARFGSGIESITRGKAQKIQRAAAYFLSTNADWNRFPCRFDALGLQRRQPDDDAAWHHLEYHGQSYWLDWRPNILFE